MANFEWKKQVDSFDERRDIIIPGDAQATTHFCVQQFIQIAKDSIEERGQFIVAVSGGSTPLAIFKELSQSPQLSEIDWSKVFCFWSDERSVPTSHPENNFQQAMKAGLAHIPIPKDHFFRMEAEGDIEEGARRYEELIRRYLPTQQFDLIMLGMGEDGHTASLFPYTHGLHTKDRLAIANYVPQKHTWRMSLTYQCINNAHAICLYILGKNKAEKVAQALTGPYDPDRLPVQRIGTPHHKALWILDLQAADQLINILN